MDLVGSTRLHFCDFGALGLCPLIQKDVRHLSSTCPGDGGPRGTFVSLISKRGCVRSALARLSSRLPVPAWDNAGDMQPLSPASCLTASPPSAPAPRAPQLSPAIPSHLGLLPHTWVTPGGWSTEMFL